VQKVPGRGKNVVIFRNFQRIHLVGIGRHRLTASPKVPYTRLFGLRADTKLHNTERGGAPKSRSATVYQVTRLQRRWRACGRDFLRRGKPTTRSHRSAARINSRDSARGDALPVEAPEIRNRSGRRARRKRPRSSIVASVLPRRISTRRLWSAESQPGKHDRRLGKGEYFIVEADESDRSFLHASRRSSAVVTPSTANTSTSTAPR